jgi:thioester reductase-like protein
VIPLSSAQQRLWFINQLGGASLAYNVQLAFRLSGPLHEGALADALRDVAERHEALRTLFRDDDGIPYQVIVEPAEADVPLDRARVDEAGLRPAMEAFCHHAFDLANELPFRAKLFVLGPEDHALVILMHHIVTDGWSKAPLVRDLATAYAARLGAAAPAWDDLAVQYGDYTLWQRDVLGSEDDPESLVSRQLAYWREALDGLPEELNLPTDRPRPVTASHQGGRALFEVTPDLHRALLGLARDTDSTLFMVLQGALAALISRHDAGADIPLGVPVAGRTDDALEHLIGFFVNTVVARIDTSGDPDFTELLRRVRRTNLHAYSNQDLPFERLVEVLNPVRSLARNPLFQVAISLDKRRDENLDLPGVTATPLDIEWDQATFDLAVFFNERGGEQCGEPGGIDGVIEFATDLFDRRTAELLASGLVDVLRTVAADPGRTLSALGVTPRPARTRAAESWSATFSELLADLDQDLPTPEAIRRLPAADRLGRPTDPAETPAGHVLLTGATGYFGTFLLDELLTQTDAHISCLVRADSAEHGMARVRQGLEQFDRWTPAAAARIQVIPADLARPELGLDKEEFARLAESVDVIYHNGAQVNIILPFEAIRAANLTSTRDLIRMATQSKRKSIHFVSTASRLGEDVEQANGYVLTKKLSETLLERAREAGLPASVYRVPRLSLDSRTARGNSRDIALRLLRTVLDVGASPDVEFAEWWVPVDEAARLLIADSCSRLDGGRFSLLTPEATSWSSIVGLLRDAGYAMPVKPNPEWAKTVRAYGSEENNLVLETLGLDGDPEDGAEENNEVDLDDALAFGEVLTVPQVSEQTVLRYVADLSPTGDFDAVRSRSWELDHAE